MLEVDHLVKRYGEVQALAGFDLSVAAGEIVGVVGHNGAGKSTFLEIVSGLIRQDSGTVLINGRPPAAARAEVGVSPQHIALYLPVTVREHLRLFGGLAGLRRAELSAAIDELAAAMHLEEFLDRRVGILSGGQQRRTQAAIALIHRPALLLLDEPTAGADPETRQALLDVVKQRAAQGTAVIYTTHYLSELSELQATIAVAKRGRVIARGSSEELLAGLPGEVRVTFPDETVSVATTNQSATLVELLKTAQKPVESVDIHHPDLDDLYRALAVDHD
ncbi:ABC transporter ATP-binding protein [Streptomyces ferrugineus]|uniref:ABC transporter ATP-binding protein n=2 Tax=Streptomyces ferrugineus TaxID=1413221 RepID=A0A7M2T1H3_9ACTN|nr:ABC transporter ATP-binding protein [Streptomyces ferrugineus]